MPDSGAASPRTLSTFELVTMVAALSALNAMSIDIMLPALPQIGAAFSVAHENDQQLVVVVYMIVFGVAQLAYGPLADTFGRRSVLNGALLLFIAGSVLCVLAPSFEIFLAARALQGLGAAATRVVSTAVVRDLTTGRRMAQVMSLAMTVFMIVPIAAPGIGQLILFVAPWRWVFAALLIYALAVFVWLSIRLPETLAPENRAPLRLGAVAANYLSVLQERTTLGYMLATTAMTACLMGYVASAEQIYVGVYGLGAAFPLAFAAVAIAMTFGTFLNSRLVMRLGMRAIAHVMVIAFVLIAALHAGLLALGIHSAWLFIVMIMANLGLFGLIGGNFNALAMERVGHVAGTASALYGAVSATFGAILGGFAARFFDGTALPFVVSLAVFGLLTLASVTWTERGRLFRDVP